LQNLKIFFIFISLTSSSLAEREKETYQKALNQPWQQVFFDSGQVNWKKKWFLDGRVGKVTNSSEGMTLEAGPEFKNDQHHMVLWTQESFSGNLKIEFNYTRLDQETRCVNILYIQASGIGIHPFEKDIYKWRKLRETPSMKMYYDHMHTYHISFAAFPNNDNDQSYLRARRYLPDSGGLKGTNIEPTYYPEGLFKPGIPHQFTVIKHEHELLIKLENPSQSCYYRFLNMDLPLIQEGRIGIRHMFTRSARYKNIRVSKLY
jgi:hypothetical protein